MGVGTTGLRHSRAFFRAIGYSMTQEENQPEWKKLYHAALLETDSNRLMDQILTAEKAIYSRLHELSRNQDSSSKTSELQEIDDALRNLRVLMSNKT